MNNLTYIIVPFLEVTQQMIEDSKEDSFSTLRHNFLSPDCVVLKWEGDTPSSLVGYTQYDHSEILMSTAGWNPDRPDNNESSSSSSLS